MFLSCSSSQNITLTLFNPNYATQKWATHPRLATNVTMVRVCEACHQLLMRPPPYFKPTARMWPSGPTLGAPRRTVAYPVLDLRHVCVFCVLALQIQIEYVNTVSSGGLWTPVRSLNGSAVNFAKIEDAAFGFATFQWPAVSWVARWVCLAVLGLSVAMRPRGLCSLRWPYVLALVPCCLTRCSSCFPPSRCPCAPQWQFLTSEGDYLLRYVVYCDILVGGGMDSRYEGSPISLHVDRTTPWPVHNSLTPYDMTYLPGEAKGQGPFGCVATSWRARWRCTV